jgi:glycosyltransferase involved in cell wall biosynthesis
VIQPSLFEGWSTVVEDAKAIGRPLIVSDLPVHKEQTENLANVWFFPKGSSQRLADVIEQLWPTLSAGPDLSGEKKARRLTFARRRVLGRQFVEIAAEAYLLHRQQLRGPREGEAGPGAA